MIGDAVWQVIKDHLKRYYGWEAPDDFREKLEQHTEVTPFDGGVFIAKGNEFDLFVVPERRGRWRIRSELSNYLNKLGRRYGVIAVKINESNLPSLRLARHFGFKEVSRDNGFIRLESTSWVT